MSKTTKLGLIIAALVAVTVLIYTAASDNIFFVTQPLEHDNTAYSEGGGKYSLYFFKDGNKIEVAKISYAIKKTSSNSAAIKFQISGKIRYKVDSLTLNFELLKPASALVLENTDSYSPPPSINTLADGSSVVFDFSDPKGSEGSLYETFYLDFSLDLSDMDPIFTNKLILVINFSMHEQSILKILRYTGQSSVQLYIPYYDIIMPSELIK